MNTARATSPGVAHELVATGGTGAFRASGGRCAAGAALGRDAIFAPRNVAVIGATETPGSVGRTLFRNLISDPFGGAVFPVNPKRASVLGIHAYRDILSVPAPVDLAAIVTPAPTVPDIIDHCVQAGVKGAMIISARYRPSTF